MKVGTGYSTLLAWNLEMLAWHTVVSSVVLALINSLPCERFDGYFVAARTLAHGSGVAEEDISSIVSGGSGSNCGGGVVGGVSGVISSASKRRRIRIKRVLVRTSNFMYICLAFNAVVFPMLIQAIYDPDY